VTFRREKTILRNRQIDILPKEKAGEMTLGDRCCLGLFVPQHVNWIDAHRAPGGNVARDERGRPEQR
jgi:hypothetical protein